MNPMDLLVLAVVAVILGPVLWYIHKSRKKGIKCIGCPDGAKCAGNCPGCTGHCGETSK